MQAEGLVVLAQLANGGVHRHRPWLVGVARHPVLGETVAVAVDTIAVALATVAVATAVAATVDVSTAVATVAVAGVVAAVAATARAISIAGERVRATVGVGGF